MRNKGTGLMALGLALILGAAALTGYNLLEAKNAEKASTILVQELRQQLPPPALPPELPVDETIPAETLPDYVRFPSLEMPVVTLEGEDYIGMLVIPQLELELPVMADWSYEALKTAPCRYEGSAYTGNLILMAHNYDSHFGRLKDLRPEDVVLFTDMEDNCFSYRVVELETLDADAVDYMSAGDWDLTLFTCTYGGQSRVTVYCDRAS